MTVLALVLFIGVAIWAWSPARKKRFDEAAQIPLQDEAQTQRSANDSRSDENTDQEQKS
ncbi:MAG: cbb3-type cytochrome c oxidase subunit 3 [Gammaproteobacteria bacterium]|nr:cbb3-type cytochrome c oxidase subunit 3 [Gammaproteobacteria bacterium]